MLSTAVVFGMRSQAAKDEGIVSFMRVVFAAKIARPWNDDRRRAVVRDFIGAFVHHPLRSSP